MSEDKDLELEDTQVEPEEETTEELPSDEEELDYDTLLAQNRELREKNKKLDGARLHYKNKVEKLNQKPQSKKEEKSSPDADNKMARLELKIDGYSDEEIDFLFDELKVGKEATKNPYVKAAIDKMREDRKLEQATNIKSGGTMTSEKKMSLDKFKNLSSAEMEKAILEGKVNLEE